MASFAVSSFSRIFFKCLPNCSNICNGVTQQVMFQSNSSAVIPQLPKTEQRCPFSGDTSTTTLVDTEIDGHVNGHFDAVNAKQFEQIPTPYSIKFIGSSVAVMQNGGAEYLHEYVDRRHKQLGPIFKDRTSVLNSTDIVFIADNKMMQSVYVNEGKHPMHLVPESWTLYNHLKNVRRGLFFMDGSEWSHLRAILNKLFLNRETVHEYTAVFNDVVSDLLRGWTTSIGNAASFSNKDANGENTKIAIINELEKDLYKWSIESLGSMIFGRRLGCVPNKHVACQQLRHINEFVACVQQIFVESASMTLIPARYAYKLNLPVWKRFEKAADGAIELAREYVRENIEATNDAPQLNTSVAGVLQQLIAHKQIDYDLICSIIVDLFIAAADTTSHGTQWALYLLAKNPECQQKLYEEVNSVVKNDHIIEEKHLTQMPYVKCIIKETLRMYPIAPFLSRILAKDIILGGYHIPKGKLIAMSIYTTGRDEKYFEKPNTFKPERWIRNTVRSQERHNAYACLPFGHGVRSCIGRRVAEVQMQLLLAKTVQKFKLYPESEKDINIKLRMITTPAEKIKLKIEERL
ncbi:cytochrome P450 315a1-like protein [Leptotrombidium deliense]|uniref:Cytochrome P450 315a1-like protein n=1 Tax=Leptotrombidium deliense TaxID=299467 RepID=A0A443SNG6_9ACAR|nr:cytochrome P450 315a1-like protein [Leptotrombidium deliense]